MRDFPSFLFSPLKGERVYSMNRHQEGKGKKKKKGGGGGGERESAMITSPIPRPLWIRGGKKKKRKKRGVKSISSPPRILFLGFGGEGEIKERGERSGVLTDLIL